FDVVDLDFAPRVLGQQDLVAGFDLQLAQRPVLLHLAAAHGHDPGFQWLLPGAVGYVEAARGLLLLLYPLHQDSVVERPDLHRTSCWAFVCAWSPTGSGWAFFARSRSFGTGRFFIEPWKWRPRRPSVVTLTFG